MTQQGQGEGTRCDPRGGRRADPRDGFPGPGSIALPEGAVRAGRSDHPRARGTDATGPMLRKVDTKHPHRGFDNLWYVVKGSASTGHSTGPAGLSSGGGARLSEGALLALRTGQGVPGMLRDRERRDQRGSSRHRVPWRAVLGEPRSEGQAGRTDCAGVAARADPGADRGRCDRPGPRGPGFSRATRDAGADPRHRVAPRGDRSRAKGAARVPGVRIHARGRGEIRSQRTAGDACAARPPGSGGEGWR